MGINFPNAPTLGQRHPTPPVAGIPVYTWDGEKWTTVGGSIAAYAPPADAVPLVNAGAGLVGTSTDYAREDHVHPTDTSRASYDAMAYSGMQINGGMEVSQELGGVARTTNGYICDGWRCGFNGTMEYDALVDGGGAGIFPLFPNYRLAVFIRTAQASLGAGDYTQIFQRIEGWRCARLLWGTANAQPITIVFWTAHNRIGTYSVVVRNGAGNRSYATTYIQAVTNIAQYNTVTIPGDVTGTWPVDNTTCIEISFSLGGGATYIASSANAWLAGNYVAAPGQINAVAATSDVFRITGVTVLPGTQAPTAAQSPNIMRPYDQELVTCKRYWAAAEFSVNGYGSGNYGIPISFPVEMRATPSMGLSSFGGTVNIGAGNFQVITRQGAEIYHPVTTPGGVYVHDFWTADARL